MFSLSSLNILTIFSRLLVAVAILPIHELAHAYVADRLGDPTAKYMGRITLNPLAHLDLVGTIALVFLGFGWAKPVPVDGRNFGNPKRGMGITAAAGPIANIILAIVLLLVNKIMLVIGISTGWIYGNAYGIVYSLIYMIAQVSTILAVFNLLPVPPLDGSKILAMILPDRIYYNFMRHERIISLVLIALLFFGILSPVISFLGYGLFDGLLFVINLLPGASI